MIEYITIQENYDGSVISGVIISVTTLQPQHNGPTFTLNHFATKKEWLEGVHEF